MRRARFVVFCISLLLGAGALSRAHADTIRVAFYDYAPMMMQDTRSGIYHDLFSAIARRTGDTFSIQYYPYARSKAMFERGEIDIEPGISANWTAHLAVPGIQSVPFGRAVDVLVFDPARQRPASLPAELTGTSLGTVRGYAYPRFEALFDNKQIERVDVVDERHLLMMLAKNGIDRAIVNRVVADYLIKETPAYRRFELGAVVGDVEIGLRIHPSKAGVVARINQAIEALQRSGDIERIYAAYR